MDLLENYIHIVTIALNRLEDDEHFELKHLLFTIQQIVPEAHATVESYYSQNQDNKICQIFYIAVEKSDGSPFLLTELKQLSQQLPLKIKEGIEYLSSSLFIPQQEEELIQSIVFLSNELKSTSDLPKTIITFQQQQGDIIRFTVVLLRLVSMIQEVYFLQELCKKISHEVRLIPERIANVGTLKEKYTKEANVFTLEVKNKMFLRKNHSVDLVKARHFIVKALEKIIGPFCDFTDPSIAPKIRLNKPDKKMNNLQILNLHLPQAAQSLDPRIGFDRTSGVVINMLYEGLYRINAQGKIEPGVAERVEISNDQKKYIFTLKETQWSNGSPLTAHDFAYAWKKILEPDFSSPYAFLFFPIKHAEAVKRGEKPMQLVGIQAIDHKNLKIELEHPTPHFLDMTASWMFSPLSQEIEQKHPGWAYHNDHSHVSNGPFKLDQWKRNDDLQLVKNPLYWDHQNVQLDQIDISVIDDEKQAIDLFYRGKLDWVGDPVTKITPSEILPLKSQGLLHSDTQYHGLYWLQLNLSIPHFQHSKMRRAFAIGTQRQYLIDHALQSEDRPAYGFALNNSDTMTSLFYEDKLEAKKLFEEGLQAMGITRKELPSLVISCSEIEEQQAVTHAIGNQWSELFNIDITYKKIPWNAYFDSLNRNDFMVGGIVWYPLFNDPIYFYNLLISKEYVVKITTWKNPLYQKLIEEAQMTLNPKTRDKLIAASEKLLIEAMPVIPLFYQKFRYVSNPKLKGYILSNTSQIDFRNAYLEKESH